MTDYKIIADIYFKGQKLARRNIDMQILTMETRNWLIDSVAEMITKQNPEMAKMELYNKIVKELYGKHKIKISERQLMRVINPKKWS